MNLFLKFLCTVAMLCAVQILTKAQSNEYEVELGKFTGERKWDIEKPGALVGITAPDFKGTDLKGKEIQLAKLKGKVVVLNFWFIACQPCQLEVAPLNEIVQQYRKNRDLVFISVARDQEDALRKHLKTAPFDFHTIADPNADIASKIYHVYGYPTTIVIDKAGKIRYYTLGGKIDENAVRADLNKKLVPVIESSLK